MVEFVNLKKFKVGERVKCNNHGDIHSVYEGVITYIHPTNGWLTVLVDKIKETSKGFPRKTKTYKVGTPYQTSFWFSCVYRADEKVKKEPEVLTGGEVIQLVSNGRKPRKTYARRASSVPKEDDFGLDEIWDEAC